MKTILLTTDASEKEHDGDNNNDDDDAGAHLVGQRQRLGVLGDVDVDDIELVALAQFIYDAGKRGAARLGHPVVDHDGVVLLGVLGLLGRWKETNNPRMGITAHFSLQNLETFHKISRSQVFFFFSKFNYQIREITHLLLALM